MEALYSKLYDKYTKLKTKKESEIDKINSDQEVKFMNCISAAEQLIEHLRNENDRLRAEINELRSEVASIRTTKDELHVEFQKLVMQEKQKNKELSIEIERLQNLQPKGIHSSAEESKTGYGSLLLGSDTLNNSDANVRTKRRRDFSIATEFISTPCNNDQLECAPVIESESDLSKQTVPSGTCLNIYQPMCCRRKIGLSGSGVNFSDPANCMFQDLIECLVGMKLSTVAQTDGVCISVLHQSSGYSFSLTWVNKAGVEEAELLYRVMSLGTFERVAPEWMREVLMFSTKMCPIFFERLSCVINLHC